VSITNGIGGIGVYIGGLLSNYKSGISEKRWGEKGLGELGQ
jgi:hypothetical protein